MNPSPHSRLRLFLFLIVDAVLLDYAFYRTVEIQLYSHETGLRSSLACWTAAGTIVLAVLLNRLYRSFHDKSWFRTLFVDLLWLVPLGLLLPGVLTKIPPTVHEGTKSSISFLWLPMEWHKYPYNIALIADTLPLASYAAVAMFFLSACLAAAKRTRILGTGLYLLIAVVIGSRLGTDQMGFRSPFFRLVFCGPWVLMAVLAWRGSLRGICRTQILAGSLAVLWTYYTAVLPWRDSSPAHLPPGTQVLYPPEDGESEFPLQHTRQIWVDPAQRALFATYGPTSGIVRLNIDTGRLDNMHTDGLIRHFWTTPDDPYLYAIEWIYDDLWTIDKATFTLLRKRHLMDGVLVAPIDIDVMGDHFYVASTEHPALTQFSNRDFRRTGQLDFHADGVTLFRSGAWRVVPDPLSSTLFVHLGMVDHTDRFQLLRVAPDPLRVVDSIDLPAGGLEMIPIPNHRSLLLPDFYSDRIFEIGMDPFAVRRIIRSVTNARSTAYDPGRDLLYVASSMTGEFVAHRYLDGKAVFRSWIGKKPSSMYYEPTEDALYIGSSAGILRLNPSEFLPPQSP